MIFLRIFILAVILWEAGRALAQPIGAPHLSTQAMPQQWREFELKLAHFQKSKSSDPKRLSLEELYDRAVLTAFAVEKVLPELSDEDMSQLHGSKVFVANREEVVFVAPRVEFFLNLAKSDVDKKFFALLRKTRPADHLPIYVTMQTDVAGCYQIDQNLVALWKEWSEFRRRFPRHYHTAVYDETESIEQVFRSQNCVCTQKEEVMTLFEQFSLEATPLFARQLKKRLREIKSGDSNVRFNCQAVG